MRLTEGWMEKVALEVSFLLLGVHQPETEGFSGMYRQRTPRRIDISQYLHWNNYWWGIGIALFLWRWWSVAKYRSPLEDLSVTKLVSFCKQTATYQEVSLSTGRLGQGTLLRGGGYRATRSVPEHPTFAPWSSSGITATSRADTRHRSPESNMITRNDESFSAFELIRQLSFSPPWNIKKKRANPSISILISSRRIHKIQKGDLGTNRRITPRL